MPVAPSIPARRTLPPQKPIKPSYDRRKGRAIAALLQEKIKRERAAGLLLTAPSPGLMKIAVAAQKYTLSPWTLRAWVQEGRLRYIRLGRQLRFTDSDIIAAINGKAA